MEKERTALWRLKKRVRSHRRAFAAAAAAALAFSLAAGCIWQRAGTGQEGVDGRDAQDSEKVRTEQGERGKESGAPGDGARDLLAGGSAGRLTYQVRQRAERYAADDGADIFQLRLSWPVLSGTSEGIERINLFFEEWAQGKLEEYEEDAESTRQSALEVYRESRDAGWAGPWGEEYQVGSVGACRDYVSVLLDSYLYEGGAHSMPYREDYAFRISDGERMELEDMTERSKREWRVLLRDRFLQKIGEGRASDYYVDAEEILRTAQLEESGYYFTDTGIVFYLPPYTVAPYSTGYVEVEIPFEEARIK
ncbi:MAG: DUF3298 domain-containing protein [Eubacteriales bacterium]|nr:DUF3298 domain-containing protein [Eubacteriales bacterium]